MVPSLAASIVLPGLISYGISECALSIRDAKLTKFLKDMSALRDQHKQGVEAYTRYLGQRDYQMQAGECPGHSHQFPEGKLVHQRLTQGCQAAANYPTESRHYAVREKAFLAALILAVSTAACAIFCFKPTGLALCKQAALSIAALASGLIGAYLPFGSASRMIPPKDIADIAPNMLNSSYTGPFSSLLGLEESKPLPRLLYTPDMIMEIRSCLTIN